jgi:hypothetical protein
MDSTAYSLCLCLLFSRGDELFVDSTLFLFIETSIESDKYGIATKKKVLLYIKEWNPHPPRRRVVVSYIWFADDLKCRTKTLPHVVHLAFLQGKITNALRSTLIYDPTRAWHKIVISLLVTCSKIGRNRQTDSGNIFKGTQAWEFFGLRFWIWYFL